MYTFYYFATRFVGMLWLNLQHSVFFTLLFSCSFFFYTLAYQKKKNKQISHEPKRF